MSWTDSDEEQWQYLLKKRECNKLLTQKSNMITLLRDIADKIEVSSILNIKEMNIENILESYESSYFSTAHIIGKKITIILDV
jgi:hypothetical protein